MKINAIDIKPGNVLEHQSKLWLVLKRELVQPGKGGAFAQVEMRDLRGGTKLNERFRTQETVERVRLDEKEMQFLFMENDQATFMDNDTYEQIAIPREMIGDPADFLRDGMICKVMLYEGTPLSVELPPSVVMEVVEADPVVRGQTASSSYKPGKLENGRRVMIPPHIGPARASSSAPPTAATSSAPRIDSRGARRSRGHGHALADPQCHGERRAEGGARPDPRLRRGRAAPGLGQGPGRIRLDRRSQGRAHPQAELTRARPGYALLFEESGATAGIDPRHRWIVDPLDGTTNFLHGIPHFAISIALERDGEIVAGVVYEPIRDEMYWAEKGVGAYVNDRRLRVSARRQLGDAVIGTGMPFRDRGDQPAYLATLAAVMAATSGVRRMGSAALDLAYVAAGRFDGFWEFGLSPWDIAAGMLLVREAGGYVSDMAGGHEMMTTGDVLAANDHLHLPLAALIREALRGGRTARRV